MKCHRTFVFVYDVLVDVLSDQLAHARARGAVFSVLRRAAPWGLRFGGTRPLTAHVLLEGQAWLEQEGKTPVSLNDHDVLLMTAGAPYTLSSAPGAPSEPIQDARQRGDDARPGPASVVLCGAYTLEGSVGRSVLDGLPHSVLLRAEELEPPHRAAITLLLDEIRRGTPGQQALLDRLLDVNLVYTLRSWWARSDAQAPGWYRALSDESLRRLLEQLHAHPEREWNVPAMARTAGMSRAALADRFKQQTGSSPGRYLTELRMRRAEDALVRSDATLASIAHDVGYRNEFAFATAFRRHHSLSPGRWRALARSRPQTGGEPPRQM